MRRSIGTPLTIGSVVAVLLIALAAGWQVMIWSGLDPSVGPTLESVLFILGTLFFVIVLIGLVWLCVWLVQEIRLNQRQRAFLDAVTHEMKTPLASYRLSLDTLRRHDLPHEQRVEFLDRMRSDLDRLDGTVMQVIAAARADERVQHPEGRVRIELGELLDHCIEGVRDRFELPERAVRRTGAARAAVRANAAELELVFRNLIQNAVQYSDDPVDVRVGVQQTLDGRVEIEIADSGIGIPSDQLRKIFGRFYRASRDAQRRAAGLGLGLFIVRHLLRRHGGRVHAQSDGAGQGSRFVVSLRAAPPAG